MWRGRFDFVKIFCMNENLLPDWFVLPERLVDAKQLAQELRVNVKTSLSDQSVVWVN
jgi:hypothetical protein